MEINKSYLTNKCVYFIDKNGQYKPLGTPSQITQEYFPYSELKLNIQGALNADEYFFMEMDKYIKPNENKTTISLPERYIINENACILFWKNGEKTVVKRCADDEFNPRLAFLTAFFQHYVDMSKNKANKYLASLQVEVKKEEPKQKPKHMKGEK